MHPRETYRSRIYNSRIFRSTISWTSRNGSLYSRHAPNADLTTSSSVASSIWVWKLTRSNSASHQRSRSRSSSTPQQGKEWLAQVHQASNSSRWLPLEPLVCQVIAVEGLPGPSWGQGRLLIEREQQCSDYGSKLVGLSALSESTMFIRMN